MRPRACTRTVASKWGVVSLLIQAVVLQAIVPASIAHAWDAYDEFNSVVLQPSRWEAGWVSPNAVEVARFIDAGALRLRLRGIGTEGPEHTDAASRTVAVNDVLFAEEVTPYLRSVEFDVNVSAAAARGCMTTTVSSIAQVRHWARWFNDGTSSAADDQSGDLQSFIGLKRIPGQRQLEVRFQLFRCDNADCTQFTALDSQTLPSTWLADVNEGQNVRLSTRINESASTIVFRAHVDGSSPVNRAVDFSTLGAPVQGVTNPDYAHVIQARVDSANCPDSSPGTPKAFGLIDANITRVRVRRAEFSLPVVGSGGGSGGADEDQPPADTPGDSLPLLSPPAGVTP